MATILKALNTASNFHAMELRVSDSMLNGSGYNPQFHEDYIASFHKLVAQWRRQTYFLSTVKEKINNPAFIRIVEMGWKAVPLIIDEIYTRPDFLFMALELIVEETPTKNVQRGDVRAMTDAWLQWYERNRINSA